MQLYVIRHAIAEDHAEGQSDSDRHLTRDGKKRLKGVVKGLRALDIEFDRVLTSPWARALETAERLEDVCDHAPISTDLLCQSPRAELLSLISEAGTDTAVVGHEPWLGELVAWLAFGDTRHGEALVLKKGGIVCLEGTAVPGGMQITAILPPKIVSAAH